MGSKRECIWGRGCLLLMPLEEARGIFSWRILCVELYCLEVLLLFASSSFKDIPRSAPCLSVQAVLSFLALCLMGLLGHEGTR